MFERVLVAYDGSPPARAGLDFAVELSRHGAEVTALQVLEPGEDATGAGAGEAETLDNLCHRLSETEGAGAISPLTIEGTRPAERAIEVAERIDADLLVTGKRGRHGIREFVLGSTAERLIQYGPCSLAVFPGPPPEAVEPVILAAYDGSEHSDHALEVASRLAGPLGAGLVVVHVVDFRLPFADKPPQSARDAMRKQGERLLKDASMRLSAPLESLRTEVREGDARAGLLAAAADHRPRLLVLGHRGVGGLTGLVLGSVARQVATAADCPVLVTKRPAD